MALIEQSPTEHVAVDVPTIDGIPLTPKVTSLDGIPTFATVEEEREHRKQKLAGALRIFGRFGFGEGVAGHITVRDPEFPDHFWVNPFGHSFRHMRVSDLILVDHHGEVVYGAKPVNRAAFVLHSAIHQARPDVVAAAHSHSPYGKAFSSLGIPLAPLTQDACIFYGDHTVITEQGGAVVFEIEAGHEVAAAFGKNKAAIHKNHGLFTVGETVDEAVFWFVSMERSCQAQLMAMAAGTPEPIRDEYAVVHGRADGRSLRRLVQLPAAVAGDLPHGSRPVRVTDVPARARVTSRPAGRFLDTASPEGLFVLSAVAQYIGATIAILLFDRVAPQTVAWIRVIGAAIAVLAVSGAFWRGWTRRQLAAAAVFGIATAAMNTCFYMAIDRTDLGKSVAIEFIGPIVVAAVMTRTRRNAGALVLAVAGVVVLGGVEIGDNTAGIAWLLAASACWAAYIVVGSRVAQDRSDRRRARRRPGDRRRRHRPVRRAGQRRRVDDAAPARSPASSSACSPTPSATASTSTSCGGSPSAASRCCWPCCR